MGGVCAAEESPERESNRNESEESPPVSSAHVGGESQASSLVSDESAESKNKQPEEDDDHLKLISFNVDGLDGEMQPERELIQLYVRSLKKQFAGDYTFIEAGKEHYFTGMMLKKSRITLLDSEIVSYPDSQMLRNLLIAQVLFKGQKLHLMTSHLESCEENSVERMRQLRLVMKRMREAPDDVIVLCGRDTNLMDCEVAEVGLPSSVSDVWEQLGEQEACRYTWDTQTNTNKGIRSKCRFRFDRLYLRQASSDGALQLDPDHMSLTGKMEKQLRKYDNVKQSQEKDDGHLKTAPWIVDGLDPKNQPEHFADMVQVQKKKHQEVCCIFIENLHVKSSKLPRRFAVNLPSILCFYVKDEASTVGGFSLCTAGTEVLHFADMVQVQKKKHQEVCCIFIENLHVKSSKLPRRFAVNLPSILCFYVKDEASTVGGFSLCTAGTEVLVEDQQQGGLPFCPMKPILYLNFQLTEKGLTGLKVNFKIHFQLAEHLNYKIINCCYQNSKRAVHLDAIAYAENDLAICDDKEWRPLTEENILKWLFAHVLPNDDPAESSTVKQDYPIQNIIKTFKYNLEQLQNLCNNDDFFTSALKLASNIEKEINIVSLNAREWLEFLKEYEPDPTKNINNQFGIAVVSFENGKSMISKKLYP
ncbi:tyrosyl-DNA phosphodiesterase 2-like, partial [Scomber scombrus]